MQTTEYISISHHASPMRVATCDGTELCTHLPLVVIDTGGEEIPGEPAESAENSGGEETFSTTASGDTMLSVKISLMEKDDTNHHISDTHRSGEHGAYPSARKFIALFR